MALLTRGKERERVVTSLCHRHHRYGIPQSQIRDLVLPIVAVGGLRLPDKRLYTMAFGLYLQHNISFSLQTLPDTERATFAMANLCVHKKRRKMMPETS